MLVKLKSTCLNTYGKSAKKGLNALGYLKGVLTTRPGLFLEDTYKSQFEAMLDTAIQHFASDNISEGLTQVETVILPKITEWVRPENRVAFRDLVGFAIFGARYSGEYYFDPPLEVSCKTVESPSVQRYAPRFT